MNVHVVANFVLLNLAALLLDKLLDDETANSVARVALACVGFDDDPAVHARSVVLLVLRSVVRVDRVRDIGADQEGACDRLCECLRSW